MPPAGLAGLQMGHRYLALVLAVALGALAWKARGSPDPRIAGGTAAAFSLTLLQGVLGVFNVLLAVPVWLTAAHLATAALIFAVLVVTALRAPGETGPRAATGGSRA